MVERIPKLDVDRMRVQRKEDAADEQGSGSQPDQQSDEKEKKSHFSPKLDFKKAMGDEGAAASHQTLWQQPSTPKRESATPQSQQLHPQEMEPEESEEMTHSTTITFLRAVGLLKLSGRPNWATVSLYAFAFIGLVSTVIFLLHALL